MMWDGAEPYCPVPVDTEPDEHILEPRCYCGRLLERRAVTPSGGYDALAPMACPVHGEPDAPL